MSNRIATAALPGPNRWKTTIQVGKHGLISDAPESKGGADLGPDPEELLLAAYGGCTVMTVQMYAQRKGWLVDNIEVTLELIEHVGTQPDRIHRSIKLEGTLDSEQRERLLAIANKCPVHRLLSKSPVLETQLLP